MQTRAEAHLFLSIGGGLLPRWQDAFRGARGADPGLAIAPGELLPDLVWMRLQHDVPAADQIAALPPMLRAAPLVVLSDLPDDEEALAAFAAGARGYANTHAAPLVLRRIAAVVLEGGLWIGESLMQRLLRATSGLAAAGRLPGAGLAAGVLPAASEACAPVASTATASAEAVVPASPDPVAGREPGWARILTDRERQVALRVAHGESNKEVARALGVTERTVKAHIGAVLEKLRVRDRLQLALVVNGQSPPSGG